MEEHWSCILVCHPRSNIGKVDEPELLGLFLGSTHALETCARRICHTWFHNCAPLFRSLLRFAQIESVSPGLCLVHCVRRAHRSKDTIFIIYHSSKSDETTTRNFDASSPDRGYWRWNIGGTITLNCTLRSWINRLSVSLYSCTIVHREEKNTIQITQWLRTGWRGSHLWPTSRGTTTVPTQDSRHLSTHSPRLVNRCDRRRQQLIIRHVSSVRLTGD